MRLNGRGTQAEAGEWQRLCRSQDRVGILFQGHEKPLEDFKNLFFFSLFYKSKPILRNCQTPPKWLYHFASHPVVPRLTQHLGWSVFSIVVTVRYTVTSQWSVNFYFPDD